MLSGTPKIGVRLALGARPGDVLNMVLASAARVIASELYGVSLTDPMVFTGVALLIAVIALAAAFFPARWAAKVDPLVALRHE